MQPPLKVPASLLRESTVSVVRLSGGWSLLFCSQGGPRSQPWVRWLPLRLAMDRPSQSGNAKFNWLYEEVFNANVNCCNSNCKWRLASTINFVAKTGLLVEQRKTTHWCCCWWGALRSWMECAPPFSWTKWASRSRIAAIRILVKEIHLRGSN